MTEVFKWLRYEVPRKRLLTFILYSIAIAFSLSVLSGAILISVDADLKDVKIGKKILTAGFFSTLFVCAAIEEIFFRFIPLYFARLLTKKTSIILFVAIISSIIFGDLHGNAWHIFLQGISGFILCVVYLKCGGMQGKIIKPLSCSTLSHFGFNSFLTLLALVGGSTTF